MLAEAGTQTSFGKTEDAVRHERTASANVLLVAWIPACAGMTVLRELPSPEQTLDVGQFQRDVSRAAVVALAGIGRCFHLAEQSVHFLDR